VSHDAPSLHAAPSQDSIAAFKWVLTNLLKPRDELHLLHVVPDVFFGPSSGSIYYCSSPDPETERMLVRSSSGRQQGVAPGAATTLMSCVGSSRPPQNCCAAPHRLPSLQWQQAKLFFVDHFLEPAKSCGLEDSVWLHLVKERRWATPTALLPSGQPLRAPASLPGGGTGPPLGVVQLAGCGSCRQEHSARQRPALHVP
jgi:hypothetical protein